MFKDYYISTILKRKNGNEEVYRELTEEMFGKHLTKEDLLEVDDKDKLVKLMCELTERVKIEESPYDMEKLTFAIQSSRSGAGGCAMTAFECLFCGKEDIWTNTNVPKICKSCAREMAKNFILYGYDIEK